MASELPHDAVKKSWFVLFGPTYAELPVVGVTPGQPIPGEPSGSVAVHVLALTVSPMAVTVIGLSSGTFIVFRSAARDATMRFPSGRNHGPSTGAPFVSTSRDGAGRARTRTKRRTCPAVVPQPPRRNACQRSPAS